MATEFGILGELQVVQDGVPLELGSLRQRALLARLLVRSGQPLTSDRLIEDLWPDDAPTNARHTLHVYISRVRATLGDERRRLSSDTSGYRLHLEPGELDAARFERLAADGRASLSAGDATSARERLEAALGLWRGPALVEFADEPFATAEATRLDQLRLVAQGDRIRADLQLGRHALLVEELRSLTLQQPFREAFWEHYMLALYRAGRQTEALQVFGEARMHLSDELGIEPGPALKRMEQRILRQDPGLDLPASTGHAAAGVPTRPRSNLPLQRTTFIGRQRDLAIAGELLAASRLLTLTGAPGSGKTRMALQLASQRERAYPDGVVLVSLAAVSDPSRIEPMVRAAFDELDTADQRRIGRPESAEDSGDLAGRLRDLCCLLILDNCEQLTGGFEPVGDILDTAPDLTVMATSRAPLRLAGEQEFPVLPLQVPPAEDEHDPESLLSYDAVALLVARARAADPGFEVTTENAAAIAGITARLDGLPLALELGASRLRLLTPQDLLERLERRLPLLTSGASDAIARHQTLRGAIAWSYELLDKDEQGLFRCLAAFVGPFTVEAAAFVAERPFDDIWNGLESLLAKSLLQRPVDTGEARFSMLETLREFAVELLTETSELDTVFQRHARYCLRQTEHAGPELEGPGHGAALARLNREVEDIRAALRRCADGLDTETGLRLASATWRYWQAAGRVAEARDWLAALLAQAGGADAVRAEALVSAAGLAYWQADYASAWRDYQSALSIYRRLEDRGSEAEVLCSMSMTATWNGEPDVGARLAVQSRCLFEELGVRKKVGETTMAEGFALWQQRRYEAARPLWEEALAISRELGADTLAVTQLAGLAGLEYHTGAPIDATRIALDALDQACDLENVAICVWLLDFVAAFAADVEPEAAVRVAGAADALRRASGGGMRIEDLHIDPARAAAARSLDPATLARSWSEGRTMSLEQAIDAARSLRPKSVA